MVPSRWHLLPREDCTAGGRGVRPSTLTLLVHPSRYEEIRAVLDLVSGPLRMPVSVADSLTCNFNIVQRPFVPLTKTERVIVRTRKKRRRWWVRNWRWRIEERPILGWWMDGKEFTT